MHPRSLFLCKNFIASVFCTTTCVLKPLWQNNLYSSVSFLRWTFVRGHRPSLLLSSATWIYAFWNKICNTSANEKHKVDSKKVVFLRIFSSLEKLKHGWMEFLTIFAWTDLTELFTLNLLWVIRTYWKSSAPYTRWPFFHIIFL